MANASKRGRSMPDEGWHPGRALVEGNVVSLQSDQPGDGEFFLVIPSFRDGGRLAVFLPALLGALEAAGLSFRARVVDDGSGEEEAALTRKVVEELRERFPQLEEALLLPDNRGKGGAIYAGWTLAGAARWVGFADADGATPASEIVRLLQAAQRADPPADAWIGSRIKMLGRRVERNLRRHLMGRVYATLASELTGLPVYDSQCGCKLVRGAAYRQIAERLREERFGFDIELLWNLQAAGFVLREFPVDWVDVPGSKVRLVRDSWRMLCSLLRLRGEVAAFSHRAGARGGVGKD